MFFSGRCKKITEGNAMKIIAHRGLLNGKDEQLENRPGTIKKALEAGFDVEVDVWYVDGLFFLGHDAPTDILPDWLLEDKRAWFHAKNTEALKEMLSLDKRVFYHTEETVVLTSRGDMWCYPGKTIAGGYCVLPELGWEPNNLIPEGVLGVCTNYPFKYLESK